MALTPTLIGYIASALVLTTFATNDLRRLRVLAILSNIAFISYGGLMWLPPVLGLHLLLLPLNVVQLMRMTETAAGADRGKPPSWTLTGILDRARAARSVLVSSKSLARLSALGGPGASLVADAGARSASGMIPPLPGRPSCGQYRGVPWAPGSAAG